MSQARVVVENYTSAGSLFSIQVNLRVMGDDDYDDVRIQRI
jgi:hypothetical protein